MTQIHTVIRDRPSAIKHQLCSLSPTIRQKSLDSLKNVSGFPVSQAVQIILKLTVFCVLMFFFPQANSLKGYMKSTKIQVVKTKSWLWNFLFISGQRWLLKALCSRLEDPTVVIFNGLYLANGGCQSGEKMVCMPPSVSSSGINCESSRRAIEQYSRHFIPVIPGMDLQYGACEDTVLRRVLLQPSTLFLTQLNLSQVPWSPSASKERSSLKWLH